MTVSSSLRPIALGAALAACAALFVNACAGGSAYMHTAAAASPSPQVSPSPSPSPSQSPSPSPSPSGSPNSCVTSIPPAATEDIGINLFSPNQAPCIDSTFQAVTGYVAGTTVTTSEVISVTHSSTDAIVFVNLDSASPHTAASLGPWTGSYPGTGPNPSATSSPKNTDISAPGFTTGNINPGSSSRKYLANVPGMYIIGCAYHYLSNNMRTVIIVQ